MPYICIYGSLMGKCHRIRHETKRLELEALWMALQISPYQPRIGVFRAPFFRAAWHHWGEGGKW